MSKTLVDETNEVAVLTTKKNSDDRCKQIKQYEVFGNWSFLTIPSLLEKVNDYRPDVIIFQYEPFLCDKRFGMPLWTVIFLFFLKFRCKKIIITFHEVSIRFELSKPVYWIRFLAQKIIAYLLALCLILVDVLLEF